MISMSTFIIVSLIIFISGIYLGERFMRDKMTQEIELLKGQLQDAHELSCRRLDIIRILRYKLKRKEKSDWWRDGGECPY